MDKKTELLAPAGSVKSLYAAVNSGCDAVYFGGKNYGARSYADNFDIDEMTEVVKYCKLRGVKTYITLNTLVKQDEFNHFREYFDKVYLTGVDGAIIQDFGLATYINEIYPDFAIHSSTQMTIHSISGVLLMKEFGFERVVLSRELSLEEIRQIVKGTDVEIECFVHGALCYSYSGQCLMSSFIGGRSGNRGKCAQPCRLPYELIYDGRTINTDGKYLLSLKDIETLKILPKLISAGITSFKVEGRMKRPEYVSGVISIYRKYIDKHLNGNDEYTVDIEDLDVLKQLFNRGGFSNGYYEGKDYMLSSQSPKNTGLHIGEVVSYNYKNKMCGIKINRPINNGDGIEILTSNQPHPGMAIRQSYAAGSIMKVKLAGDIKRGNKVFRTKDIKLNSTLQKNLSVDNYKRDIELYVKAHIDKQLYIKAQCDDITVERYGVIVEKSQKGGTESSRIVNQLKKTGNTVFNVVKVDYDIDNNIFIPISKINEIRREIIEEIENIITANDRTSKFTQDYDDYKDEVKNEINTPKRLTVLVNKYEQIKSLECRNAISRVYLELANFDEQKINNVIDIYSQRDTEVYIALPYIQSESSNKYILGIMDKLNHKIDGYLIRSYGQYYMTREYTDKIVLDYTFNIFNNQAIKGWRKKGIESITPSIELNIKELNRINLSDSEIVVYGYISLMITKQCVINNTLKCDKKDGVYYLKDRLGNEFACEKNCKLCINKIYNSKPIYMGRYIDDLLKIDTNAYRLNFTFEDSKTVEDILDGYERLINIDTIKQVPKLEEFTKGHFFRGVE